MALKFSSLIVATVALALSGTISSALADPIGSGSGFLPSYAGPQNGDLDITGGEAFLDGSNFVFDATFNANVGSTAGVFYVWGVDRGLNIAPFGAFRPGVLFDAVVISAPSLGQNFVVDLIANTMTPLPLGDVFVSGNTLSLTVPVSLLPTLGFAPRDYLVNLWTRFGLDPSDNTQIAEFAPSDSDVPVTPAPEPATLMLMGAGLLGLVGMRRKQATKKPRCTHGGSVPACAML